MNHFKQIETFVSVVQRGTLTAAAHLEGVAPAVIGRRLDALESRLGVKLLVRTTRRISLTFEGSAFLEDCLRILNDLHNAEASVAVGSIRANGHLRITAPAGFGRRHVAPLIPAFLAAYPEISLSLDLSDRLVDLISEGYDCAVRLGELSDSSLVSTKLADNQRVCVASPAYLQQFGTPYSLEELCTKHRCLVLGAPNSHLQRGWAFRDINDQLIHLKVSGPLECSDGAVLREWCLLGLGIAWRSMWEVEADIAEGRLIPILESFAAPPIGIHIVMPQRKHLPVRLRLFVDHLRRAYSDPDYWKQTLKASRQSGND